MKVRGVLSLALGLPIASAAIACGSDGVNDYRSLGGGQPASAVAEKPEAGHGGEGGKSTGSGSSSGGSTGGSSSGGGDGGSVQFGSVDVASFTLINASVTSNPAGAKIPGFNPIAYGATIDLAGVGHELSMVVTPPQVSLVGSMAFALDATFTHTANTLPYSLCGDDGKGKFAPCPLSVGKHQLTVTVYPQEDLGGAPYQPPTVFEFTVVDSSADAGDAGAD